jgi:hypothetical protein
MGEDADVLKDMLARKERKEGTLAGRELYRNTRQRAGGRAPDLLLYVDGVNLFTALRETGELSDKDMKMASVLGLAALEALDLDFTIEPDSLVMRGFLGVTGPKTGLLKLLDGKNSALLPARYTPADALSAGAWALDLPALWEEVRKMLDGFREGTTAAIDERMKMVKEQMDVDIAADIIATLGAELTYHSMPPGDAAFGPAAMIGRVALALELKERERFEGALDKLLAALGPIVATQDYLGTKLRTMLVAKGFQPGMTVLPDRLLLATNVDDAKEVVTRYGKEAKGFLDREDIAKAIAKLPPQRFVITVEDAPKSLSASMSMFANAMGMVGGGQPDVMEVVDFSLFPSAEVLAKYLGISATCIVNEEDGVSLVSMFNLVAVED